MNTAELNSWLKLNDAYSLKPHALLNLLNTHKITSIQTLSKTQLEQVALTPTQQRILQQTQHPDLAQTQRWLDNDHHTLITWHNPNYPPLLKEISDPPILIYIEGNPACLITPQIAIVGSRHATPAGLELSHHFAAELATAGLTITSGLAKGIDGAAHRGCLTTQQSTIAVMGCGLNMTYPPSHRKLAQQVSQQGALISEFPLLTTPRRDLFPRRNRIISGLSLGTLIVEAKIRSGSLITAKLAAEQGREVFAIPGSIRNPYSSGCHWLIQMGAQLTDSANQLVELIKETPLYKATGLAASQTSPNPPRTAELDTQDQNLLDCVGFSVTTIDHILAKSALSRRELTGKLLKLELSGYITPLSCGYIRVK